MFKNRSITGFIGTVLALAYGIYLVSYFASINAEAGSDSEAVGSAIASILVLPHIIVVWIGVIFGVIGFFTRKAGFLLTAAILYAGSAALFFLYAVFLIPSIVLGFVGYVQQKKINSKS
jgi:hypothetical protein